ncbi:MAG: hypothetical protein R6U64_09690 [Bacteroidales bacterium]
MEKIQDMLISLKKTAILMVILILPSWVGSAQEVVLERSSYKLVQIVLPGADYHDDGTRFTRFPAYVIYNAEEKDILRLPSCLHAPFTIRMLPGTYRVEAVIEGRKIKSSFEVAPEAHFQQFDMPASEDALHMVQSGGDD